MDYLHVQADNPWYNVFLISLQGLCRTVYGPVFPTLDGNECRSAYSGFERIYIAVFFHFQEINATQNYDRTDDELADDILPIIRTELLNHLSFVDNKTLCRAYIHTKESNGGNTTNSAIEFIIGLTWLSYYSRLVPSGVLKLYQPDTFRIGLKKHQRLFPS